MRVVCHDSSNFWITHIDDFGGGGGDGGATVDDAHAGFICVTHHTICFKRHSIISVRLVPSSALKRN